MFFLLEKKAIVILYLEKWERKIIFPSQVSRVSRVSLLLIQGKCAC